jgi:ssDNA-binding Zn-finger/Zn-ribbon topoisomerase 1
MINEETNEKTKSTATILVITVDCEECGQPNSILLTSSRSEQFCVFCSASLSRPEIYEVRGFVYVLSNKLMPGVLKIGFTERDIENRVHELSSSTGVPATFDIEAYFPTDNPIHDEAKVHKMLAEYQIENKEFFKLTVKEAVNRMSKIFKLSPIIAKRGFIIFPRKFRWLKCETCTYVWKINYDKAGEKCPKCGRHFSKSIKSPYMERFK